MTPEVRLAVLKRSLEQNVISDWETARHMQAQRDEYTSKIRFGALALNAASIVTVLNIGAVFPAISASEALTGTLFFIVGVIAGGQSLISHQNKLITTAGTAYAIARHRQRAITLAEFPPDSAEYVKLGEALADIDRETKSGLYDFSATAIWMQHVSQWAWVGGVISLALTELAPRIPWLAQFT